MLLNERRYLIGNKDSWIAVYTNHIGSGGSPYMFRYVLRLPSRRTLRLQKIMRSDREKALHDHPMGFWTLLLTGGYTEVLPVEFPSPSPETKTVERKWLSLRWVPADHPHRLILHRPVWTLMFADPASNPPRWGFYVGGHTSAHWVDRKAYSDAERP